MIFFLGRHAFLSSSLARGISPAQIEVFTDAKKPVTHSGVCMAMNGIAQIPADNSNLDSFRPFIVWQLYPRMDQDGTAPLGPV